MNLIISKSYHIDVVLVHKTAYTDFVSYWRNHWHDFHIVFARSFLTVCIDKWRYT